MEERKRRGAKNKRRIRQRILLLCVVVVVLIGVAAALLLTNRNAVPEVVLTAMAFSPGDEYVFTGSGFWYAKDGTLVYDELGSDKNDVSYAVTNTAFALAASSGVQAFYNETSLKIIGEQYPVEFTGRLLRVACGLSYVAALRTDASGQEFVQVFDTSGATRDQIDAGDQFIIDFGFFNTDSEYLYVVGISIASGTPISTITVYNVTNKATSGVMQVQSQLIERMHFTKTGIFALGTNQIIRFGMTDNSESYRSTVYGWQVLDVDTSSATTAAFLLRPRSNTALGTVKLLQVQDGSVPSAQEQIVLLPAGTLSAFLMNGKLVAVQPGGYYTYSMSGRQTGEFRFASPVEEVCKLSSGLLLLRAGNSYYTAAVA